jgi:hypothetical protein
MRQTTISTRQSIEEPGQTSSNIAGRAIGGRNSSWNAEARELRAYIRMS